MSTTLGLTASAALRTLNYRQTIPCADCRHASHHSEACGSQSFINVVRCKKAARTPVDPKGTCDAAEIQK